MYTVKTTDKAFTAELYKHSVQMIRFCRYNLEGLMEFLGDSFVCVTTRPIQINTETGPVNIAIDSGEGLYLIYRKNPMGQYQIAKEGDFIVDEPVIGFISFSESELTERYRIPDEMVESY